MHSISQRSNFILSKETRCFSGDSADKLMDEVGVVEDMSSNSAFSAQRADKRIHSQAFSALTPARFVG
jgi:hypothetical protein